MLSNIIYALAGGITLVLLIVVLFSELKSRANIVFALFLSSVLVWIVTLFIYYNVTDLSIVLFVGRLNFVAAAFIAYLIFTFTLYFPKKIFKIRFEYILLAETLILSALTLFTSLVDSQEIVTGFSRETIYGPLYSVYIVHFMAYTILGFYILLKKYKTFIKLERLQIKFIFLGLGLSIIYGSLTNIFIPLLTGYYDIQNFGVIAPIFLAVFTTYSIRKHNLLNIKVIATESLTFLIWIALFLKLFVDQSLITLVTDLLTLILTFVFGIFLIRSVMSEVKQREILEELTKKLTDLDKQKDEFLSMAAHELRAPMTAIKGYVSMVLEGDTGDIPEKARGYLADTSNITDRLVRLVNNMLNVSRIEEGRMVYQVEEANLSEPIRSVFSQFEPEAQRKGLEYKLEIDRTLKDKVVVDPDRVQEIIGNLLSNAVKYTDTGFVKVKLSQPNDKTVRCEVSDSGPGISDEEQEKLFQKFHRVESNVGKTTGTGLGLYITRLIIEKFNGKVGVISKEGEGSTFWFELPLAAESQSQNPSNVSSEK